jgi:hypothetical protein
MSAHKPNSCNIITSIISSLSTARPPQQAKGQPLTSLLSQLSETDTKHARSLMLTLHFLFPHDLLPALDLLDRKLVTCLQVREPPVASQDPTINKARSLVSETYYVQSASAVTSKLPRSTKFRNTFNPSDTCYEVHLDSWSCSCPGFAYSAFGGFDVGEEEVDAPESVEDNFEDDHVLEEGWVFGGSLTRNASPVAICKHILAVSIGKAAPNLFSDGVDIKAVSCVEIAGWAGGWGD